MTTRTVIDHIFAPTYIDDGKDECTFDPKSKDKWIEYMVWLLKAEVVDVIVPPDFEFRVENAEDIQFPETVIIFQLGDVKREYEAYYANPFYKTLCLQHITDPAVREEVFSDWLNYFWGEPFQAQLEGENDQVPEDEIYTWFHEALRQAYPGLKDLPWYLQHRNLESIGQ